VAYVVPAGENCYKLEVRRPPEEEIEVSRDFVAKLTMHTECRWNGTGGGMQWGQRLDFVGKHVGYYRNQS
jgi:hypothetical protein